MAVNIFSTNPQTQFNQLLFPPINQQSRIIPIWLRDTYARIQSDSLYDLKGYNEENVNSEMGARDSLSKGISKSDLFLSGGDVFIYLNRNLDHGVCSQTVSIIIHGLRDLYWTNRSMLSIDELPLLQLAMRQPLPTFKNIFEYKSLEPFRDIINTPMYQLFGIITPYSVIHIPVRHFIESINRNEPIQAALTGTDIIIQLNYQPYDFWDFDTQSIINHINLDSRCP
jgi:hypothetical protein